MSHYKNHTWQLGYYFLIRIGDAERRITVCRDLYSNSLRYAHKPRACAGEYESLLVEQLDTLARIQFVGDLLSLDWGARHRLSKLANQHLGSVSVRIDDWDL